MTDIWLTVRFVSRTSKAVFCRRHRVGESYLDFRCVLKPDGTRLIILFADYAVTLSGHGLASIRNRIETHYEGVIR